MRSLGYAVVAIVATTSVATAQSQLTPEQLALAKNLARMNAASQYYIEKPDPDKARRYLHSMYMYLRNIKFSRGTAEAETIFFQATGINVGIDRYFKSMGIVGSDGTQLEIPKEPEKKSFTCDRGYAGSVSCHED